MVMIRCNYWRDTPPLRFNQRPRLAKASPKQYSTVSQSGVFQSLKTGVRSMRHAVIVLVAVACLSVFARTQTADELINKNIQAKGGIEKIKAIKSIKMTGKLNGGGGVTAIGAQENVRPVLVRENLSLQGMAAVQT